MHTHTQLYNCILYFKNRYNTHNTHKHTQETKRKKKPRSNYAHTKRRALLHLSNPKFHFLLHWETQLSTFK